MKKAPKVIEFSVVDASESHRAGINALLLETGIADNGYEGSLENFWVAIHAGTIVGCAALEFINKRAAVFSYLAVSKPLRRRGIGSALIQKRFEVARSRKIKVLALATMYYFFNKYKKRGFRVVKRVDLPEDIRTFEQFTSKRYMKCGVMVNDNF